MKFLFSSNKMSKSFLFYYYLGGLLLRTLYIEGERKLDFAGWCGAIQEAARSGGDTLSEQQLTETDVPVIVLSCIGFITQYGKRIRTPVM